MILKKQTQAKLIPLPAQTYLSVKRVDILDGVKHVKLSNLIEHTILEILDDVYIKWVCPLSYHSLRVRSLLSLGRRNDWVHEIQVFPSIRHVYRPVLWVYLRHFTTRKDLCGSLNILIE